MAKLEGKLPFVGAIYTNGKSKIKVIERERIKNGPVVIHFQHEHGKIDVILSTVFYDKFKRMKEGTPFKVSGDWNE